MVCVVVRSGSCCTCTCSYGLCVALEGIGRKQALNATHLRVRSLGSRRKSAQVERRMGASSFPFLSAYSKLSFNLSRNSQEADMDRDAYRPSYDGFGGGREREWNDRRLPPPPHHGLNYDEAPSSSYSLPPPYSHVGGAMDRYQPSPHPSTVAGDRRGYEVITCPT